MYLFIFICKQVLIFQDENCDVLTRDIRTIISILHDFTVLIYNILSYYLIIFDEASNNNKAPETGEWVCGVGVGVRC